MATNFGDRVDACVVTPTHFDDGTTLTFDAVGEYARLIFDVDGWKVIFTTATLA